jgi:hypothetical protein
MTVQHPHTIREALDDVCKRRIADRDALHARILTVLRRHPDGMTVAELRTNGLSGNSRDKLRRVLERMLPGQLVIEHIEKGQHRWTARE